MGEEPCLNPHQRHTRQEKDRQGGQTQVQFANEIGISMQLLSQIYKGDRSPGNELVLKYLAPKGKKFVHHGCWTLVEE